MINSCWEREELFDEMNKADLAVIYKKGTTEKPENYRPIALLNVSYKLMASMIQNRLSDAMDDRIDPAQFGFRKKTSTAQPVHIYRRIEEMHEEARIELITILLDWEKAFDKIHQGKLLEAPRRIGIPSKMVRVIESMYRAPRFSIREKGKRSTDRRQRTGIRQGCPLSPYLFIIVSTVIMTDIEKGMTEGERNVMTESQPTGAEGHNKLFYADDTLRLASTAEAAELMLRKIQTEFAKYNMRPNQRKRVLLRMNSIHNVYYTDGEAMPVASKAQHLGTSMDARVNPHVEINARITNTRIVLSKLDIFWKRAPVSITWKFKVHDAAIASKLLYGLESASLAQAEHARLDAFQVSALRKIFRVPHPYYSGVSNNRVMEVANQRSRLAGGETITHMSTRFKDRQIKFLGHLIRASDEDLTKTCTLTARGNWVCAGWKRMGRPRLKWYDRVMNLVIEMLQEEGIIIGDWEAHMRREEVVSLVMTIAESRSVKDTRGRLFI